MTCHRCHGFMCPADLLGGASGSGLDSVRAWRCVACGEIIDLVIVQNRIRLRDQRSARRQKKPRQQVRGVLLYYGRDVEHSSRIGPKGLKERAMDNFVPICCFCSKVRDDKNMEVGKGPWVDLSIYAISRKLPLSHGFVFSHGYCPDCVAHYDERLAAYRSTPVWASLKSLREAERRLMARTGRGQRNIERS